MQTNCIKSQVEQDDLAQLAQLEKHFASMEINRLMWLSDYIDNNIEANL